MSAARPPSRPAELVDFARLKESLDLRVIVGARTPIDRDDKIDCVFHAAAGQQTPSLHIYKDHYYCFSCGEKGDTFDWLGHRDGMTAIEAARIVAGIADPRGHRRPAPAPRPPAPAAPRPEPPAIWKDPTWQGNVNSQIRNAERSLWVFEGRAALNWLRVRGLDDETIARFRLGWVAGDTWTGPIPCVPAKDGRPGGKLFIPRGITLPLAAPGASYSDADTESEAGGVAAYNRPPRWIGVKVRCVGQDLDGPRPDRRPKYLALRGTESGYLYPYADFLPTQDHPPFLVVEGEFDALLAWQHVGHLAHAVTAGSASIRRFPQATALVLARAPWLLLAHDHDAAGVEAAMEWRAMYPHKARRLVLPHGKDLGEFVQAGGDAAGWLGAALAKLPGGASP